MSAFDLVARPQAAWLTINRVCDARCPHCYAKGTRYNPKDDMALETAEKILSMLKSMDIKLATVLGGEPLLWEPLIDYNLIAKQYGITTKMATNAFRFGDDDFWQRYLKASCDSIGISIKGVGAEMLKRLAKVSNYEKAEKGIRRALDFYKNGAGTVYSSLMSLEDLWQIASTLHEWGANTFSIGFACATLDENGKPSKECYMIEPEQIEKFVEMYERIDELYEGSVGFEPQLPFCMFDTDFIAKLIKKGQLSNGCFVNSRGGFTLDKDSNVLICNSIYREPVATFGKDFTDGDSLLEFLNSEHVKSIYRELLRYPSDVCPGCRWSNYCRGGCVINWTKLNPNILQSVLKEVS